jgi:DNA-binding NarL/FixJ family response regulator
MKKLKHQLMLIIDDSPIIRERLMNMVKKLELFQDIRLAGSYREAEQLIQEKNPQVILLDLNLPDKNGFEILKMLKRKNIVSTVVVVSNNADKAYREQSLLLGAYRFIDKSNEFELIEDILREIASSPDRLNY